MAGVPVHKLVLNARLSFAPSPIIKQRCGPISPMRAALSSGESFLEPLQCGAVRTMGIHKPWSPTRSYGLVARLDSHLRPIASYHSRAGGRRHGITSVVQARTGVLVASKGGNAILQIRS